ncbi:Gfo/Idh/MocA family protein [Yoonia sediminilitoris]|uniref:Putative dehydrogenase n=1 Tax=Yoonia sediminilitoris TaxID=1286148 RepID=A0A2T6KQG7_9RHOB|nr:Gfo/Idh/MocA family oxidoreductase [Yoonia sediminilitoris]PUB18807.1 putative dehydrogenase [Yoonia sediminilitoris]RCW98975.1 putative dehydrogenase [Yoonia sediminilitoris]
MQPIRWGVLGAAEFALNFMAPAIHAARGAQFSALATSDPQKAEGFQAFAPDIQIYDSYDALLAAPDIDAVYIPLPNHLHVAWTLKALEAGKHVLCEKPMVMEDAEFDALIAARDTSGKLAAEAYMIVHHPQFLRARELVAAGAIGNLVHVDTVFSYNNAEATDNIRNRPETGGGGLRDIGVYTFGAARFVTGLEPAAVPYAKLRYENDVDVFAQVAANFPDFTYSAIVSMRMAKRQEITFHGDSGVLTLTCPFNANVHDMAQLVLEQGDRVTTERWPGVNQYVLQVESFCRSAQSGAAYPCPLEFSRGTQKMIEMVVAAGGPAK